MSLLTREQISSVMHYPSIAAAADALGVPVTELSLQHRKLFHTKWNIGTCSIFALCCKMYEVAQLPNLRQLDAKSLANLGPYFQAALHRIIQYPASEPESDKIYRNNLYKASRLHERLYLNLLINGIRLTWNTAPKNHQFGFLPQDIPVDDAVEIDDLDAVIDDIDEMIDALDDLDEIIDPDQALPVAVSTTLAPEVIAPARKTRSAISARPDASSVSSLLAFEEMDGISSDDSDSDFEEDPGGCPTGTYPAPERTKRVQMDDSDSDFEQGPPRKKVKREQTDDSESDDDFVQKQPRMRVKREQTDSGDKDFVCKYKVIKVEVAQSDDEQQDDSLDDYSFPDFTTMPN